MNKKIKVAVLIILATTISGVGIFFGVREMKLKEYKNEEVFRRRLVFRQ